MDERRTGGVWIVVALSVPLLLIIYVLSIGPVSACMSPFAVPRWINTVYYPLYWLCEHWKWFGDLIDCYISYWC
jgi:hypothetical protein